MYLDIKELSKRKYKSNLKNKFFMKILLSLILIIIIGTTIWLFYGEMDVVIKANGVINNKENISYIYSIKGGYVKRLLKDDINRVEKEQLLFSLSNPELMERKKYIENKIDLIENKIGDLLKIITILRSKNSNVELKTELFKNELKSIQNKIKHLKNNIKLKEDNYNKLKKFSGLSISENKLVKEKNEIDNLRYELNEYKQNKIIDLEKRICSYEDKLIKKEIELANINNNLKKYIIYAPISGKIEYINNYNIGDYIPGGVKIMRIIPQDYNSYIVELVIKNKDILKLNTGDKVKYKIASYPYKEFGIAEGKILKIDSAATEVNGNNYIYKVKATIGNSLKKGDIKNYVQYKNGMLTKASIMIRERKIIYYILEKLDFLTPGVL